MTRFLCPELFTSVTQSAAASLVCMDHAMRTSVLLSAVLLCQVTSHTTRDGFREYRVGSDACGTSKFELLIPRSHDLEPSQKHT